MEPGRLARPVPGLAREGRQGWRQDRRHLDRQQGRQAHGRSNGRRRLLSLPRVSSNSFMRARTVLCALLLAATPLEAQNTADGLAVGRKMLMEDNPGELWLDRGKRFFHEKRGPKQASLEQCDFGLGPG